MDYYALPQSGPRAWPDRQLAGRLPFAEKSVTVEKALLANIRSLMDDDFDSRRFLPFVMIYEFEGLLFSDCASFGRGMGYTNHIFVLHHTLPVIDWDRFTRSLPMNTATAERST